MSRPGLLLPALLAGATLWSAVAAAQPTLPDHDSARAALARGEVKPLDEILSILKPGLQTFVGIGLDRADGRWVYEMTMLTAEGRYRVVTVDAATARILNEELK